MNILKDYINKDRKLFFIVSIFKVMEAIMELVFPLLVAYLINDGILKNKIETVQYAVTLMIIISVINFFISIFSRLIINISSKNIGMNLRTRILEHIFKLKMQDREFIGETKLLNIINSDTYEFEKFIDVLFINIIKFPFISIGIIIITFFLSPVIGCFILFLNLIFYVFFNLIIKKGYANYEEYKDESKEVVSIMLNTIKGIKVIKSINIENKIYEDIKSHILKYKKSQYKYNTVFFINNIVFYFIVDIVLVFILYKVYFINVSIGNIIAIINYIVMLLSAFKISSEMMFIHFKMVLSIENIERLLNFEEEKDGVLENKNFDILLEPTLEIKNLSFNYGGEEAIKNISLDLFRGDSIGVVGYTGSGKSTFAKLLARELYPEDGMIFVQGYDITKLKKSEVIKSVYLCPQTVDILSGNVKENIVLLRKFDLIRLNNAIKKAKLKDFIKKFSIAYKLEYNGNNISKKISQKLLMARAIYSDYLVIIVDDCLNSISVEEQLEILDNIKDKNKIIIVISHDINVLKKMSKIAVFDKGRIVAVGNHKDLLRKNKIYQEISYSQGVIE